MPARAKPQGSQAHHRDTPPEDVDRVEAGLLACGSAPSSGLPGLAPSGPAWRWLTAHSCGGSAGIGPDCAIGSAPASLLAPGGVEFSGEPRCPGLWASAHHSSSQI